MYDYPKRVAIEEEHNWMEEDMLHSEEQSIDDWLEFNQ